MTQQATTGTSTHSTRTPRATETTSRKASKTETATTDSVAREEVAPMLRHVDPATLVIGTNVRLDTSLDADFVASIKARGVLQPIVVVETSDGRFAVRYGQRRTLAAVQAKRTSVPVLVVPDSDDAQRLIDQMAENDHRTGLTQSERLAGFEQLAALGLSAAQIAKQTATATGQVKAALAVAKSATASQALAATAMTFTEAAVLAEFEDDEAALAKLHRVVGTRGFDHVAQQLRDVRDDRARVAEFAANLAKAGHPVLTERPEWTGLARRFADLLRDGQPVAEVEQLACPALALVVTTAWGWTDPATRAPIAELLESEDSLDNTGRAGGVTASGWSAASPRWQPVATNSDTDDERIADENVDQDDAVEDRLVHADGRRAQWDEYLTTERWCADPAVHGYVDRYTRPASSLAPKAKMADLPEAEREAAKAQRRDVITSNKEWDSAEKVRRAWLVTVAGRKTPPKGAGQFLATAMLSGDMHRLMSDYRARDRVAKTFGVADEDGRDRSGRHINLSEALATLAEKVSTDQRGVVATLAVVLAAYECSVDRGSWRTASPATRRYLEFLAGLGYELSRVEHRACGHELPAEDAAVEGATATVSGEEDGSGVVAG